MTTRRSASVPSAQLIAALCALASACGASEPAGELDSGVAARADSGSMRDAGRSVSPPRDASFPDQDSGSHDAAREDGGATCAQGIPHPLLATCAVSETFEDFVDTSHRPGTGLQQKGTVVELGTGTPPEECFSRYEHALGGLSSSEAPEIADARWMRIENSAKRPTVVAVIAPDFEWPVQLEDAISLRYERSGGPFEPTRGRVELRTQDGSLLVWFGFAGRVDQLPTPAELTLRQGAETCRISSQCAPLWGQYELQVQLQDETDATALAYGEQAMLGDLHVTHGGVDLEIVFSMCPDAFVASAAVAAHLTR